MIEIGLIVLGIAIGLIVAPFVFNMVLYGRWM